MSYWLHFEDRAPACVEVESGGAEAAMLLGEELTGCKVVTAVTIPYPAAPRLNNISGCPSFCHDPERCAGRGSCPKNHACND